MKTSIVDVNNLQPYILFALVDFFSSSIKNIHNYDELPDNLKMTMSRYTFNQITTNS